MNDGSDLFIILVSYNRLEYTKRTIDSLRKTVPQARIIIYDNHSDEAGMQDYLLAVSSGEYNKINLFLAKKNVGWGKGVNDTLIVINKIINKLGDEFQKWNPNYFLISNNDVEYYEGWYDKCIAAYNKFPLLGLLGVWKHSAHGIIMQDENLVVKDQMPAVGWLMKPKVLKEIGPFAEHGSCATKGGNGEDVDYCIRVAAKGYYVAGLPEDVANHIDGE